MSIALNRTLYSFGATLKFEPHFFAFNGIIQTNLVAFSMKTSRACTDMLSSKNDDFKFLESAENIKVCAPCTCTIVPGLVERFYLYKPVH